MTITDNNKDIDGTDFKGAAIYCIKVQGIIDEHFAGYFGDMVISTEKETEGKITGILTGRLKDQSELLGVLNALHNLNLPIVSMKTLDKKQDN